MLLTNKFILGMALATLSCAAQEPQLIRGLSAMNAASYIPAGVPHAGVAPGSRMVVLGRDFGFSEPQEQMNPDSLQFAGVSASVSVGGSSTEAYVMYVSATRVEVILPANTPQGAGTLTVVINGKELTAPVTVVPRAPGIRTLSRMGTGSAVAVNAGTQPITMANPAVVGEMARLTTTGIGSDDALAAMEILVAGKPLPAAAITRRPDGFDEVDFQVPEVAPGCGVPVAIRIGEAMSNFATLPVGTSGVRCSDPSIPSGVDYDRLLKEGARVGAISLGRTEISTQGFKMQSDAGGGSFLSFTPEVYAGSGISPFGTTIGSCTLLRTIEQDVPDVMAAGLDAGASLSVNGPLGARKMDKAAIGSYAGSFGEKMIVDIPGFPGLPGGLFLDAGEYTIAGTGGADVGSFSAVLRVPNPLDWTNADTLGTACGDQRCIDRTKDLPITWTAGDSGRMVTVTGLAVASNQRPSVATMFFCTERADRGQLTVPSAILSALPASPTGESESAVTFTVAPIGAAATFSATGLDLGTISYSQTSLRTVSFK
jgi:uncharacterized protein (TIGR03437 family)